jgi:hypothetical protein
MLHRILSEQRQHSRYLTPLASGEHTLRLFMDGGSASVQVTIDASALPCIGDVVIGVVDAMNEPSYCATLPPAMRDARYIAARILAVSRGGSLTVRRLEHLNDVQRWGISWLDPSSPAAESGKTPALFIDGVVRSARVLNVLYFLHDDHAVIRLGEFADVVSDPDRVLTRRTADSAPSGALQELPAAAIAEKKASDFQFGIRMAVAAVTVVLNEEPGAERRCLLSAAIENLELASRVPEPRLLRLVPRGEAVQ